MKTPWGTSLERSRVARGITYHMTEGHGGLKVAPSLNAKIPAVFRKEDGWYEEDCEWAIVAAAFPQHFADKQDAAKSTLKHYYPEAYERFYGGSA